MDYISTHEAAKMLGVSPRRVRQLADELGGVLMAGRLVFLRATIKAAAKIPRPKRGYPKGRPRTPKGKKK